MPAKKSSKSGKKTVENTRERILSVALTLLSSGGRDAVTTRAVAEAAGVQPPVLYRHFKDKEGLLGAMTEHGFSRYLAQKRSGSQRPGTVDSLRAGWDQHVQFGLEHPMLYLLMYAEPSPGRTSAAASHAFAMLREQIAGVAAAGHLRVTEEQAVSLYHASAVGVVLSLLKESEGERDLVISTMAREAALAAMTNTAKLVASKSPMVNAAVTLRANLAESSAFSPSELALLQEWLGRLTQTS
jgi:AcrR family transcriptional regulator